MKAQEHDKGETATQHKKDNSMPTTLPRNKLNTKDVRQGGSAKPKFSHKEKTQMGRGPQTANQTCKYQPKVLEHQSTRTTKHGRQQARRRNATNGNTTNTTTTHTHTADKAW